MDLDTTTTYYCGLRPGLSRWVRTESACSSNVPRCVSQRCRRVMPPSSGGLLKSRADYRTQYTVPTADYRVLAWLTPNFHRDRDRDILDHGCWLHPVRDPDRGPCFHQNVHRRACPIVLIPV